MIFPGPQVEKCNSLLISLFNIVMRYLVIILFCGCLWQVQKIKRLMEKSNYTDVTVGSVEEFQGQERRVIIISTVRSNTAHLPLDYLCKLGFLQNPKVLVFPLRNLVLNITMMPVFFEPSMSTPQRSQSASALFPGHEIRLHPNVDIEIQCYYVEMC